MNKTALSLIGFVFVLISIGLTYLFFLEANKENIDFEIEKFSYIPKEDLKKYNEIQANLPEGENLTKFTPQYTSNTPEEENLEEIQCPIPKKDRVPNYTGIQCVWSSIEMLGRWAEEPKLINPPITSRSDCKSYSSPSLAATRLKELNVKFKQSYNNHEEGIKLIKKSMEEGRGCLWGVPGHAMVLIHYNEERDIVKWVDNSDSRLAVQTTTVEKFKKRWDSWVLVIYADNDLISYKLNRGLANKIPINDMQGNPVPDPKEYIRNPKKEELIPLPN